MTREPDDAREALDAIRAVGGEPLVHQLLASFVRYVAPKVEQAEEAAARHDAGEVGRIAHSVKSSAKQLGAHTLAAVCDAAESDAIAGETTHLSEHGVKMREEFAKARAWMEAVGREE